MTVEITNLYSPSAAAAYYAGPDNYWQHGQAGDFTGHWHGNTAREWGIEGHDVEFSQFENTLKGLHPVTGTKLLAQYHKGRMAGYDITFSPPKSVSVMAVLMGDKRLVKAFREAANETMRSLEREAGAQIKKYGKPVFTQTGNLAWAEHIHLTTRPQNGWSDMQLHGHYVVPSLTRCPDSRYRAVLFEKYGIKPSTAARGKTGPVRSSEESLKATFDKEFLSRLAHKVEKLGYATYPTEHGFEIRGVPATVLKKFSRRNSAINDLSDALGMVTGAGKARVAQASRERKDHEKTWDQMHAHWMGQLTGSELRALKETLALSIRHEGRTRDNSAKVFDATLDRMLRQRTRLYEHQILASAMKNGIGSVTPEGLRARLEERIPAKGEKYSAVKDVVRQRRLNGRDLISTQGALQFEQSLWDLAKAGKGAWAGRAHIGVKAPKKIQAALLKIIGSRDRSILFRRKFPSPKQAAKERDELIGGILSGLRDAGYAVMQLGPDNIGSLNGLVGDGVVKDHFVELNKKVENGSDPGEKPSLIWVEDAHKVGAEDLYGLIQSADKLNAKVVFSTGLRPARGLEEGEPLSILSDLAGIQSVSIEESPLAKIEAAVATIGSAARKRIRKTIDLVRKVTSLGQAHQQNLASQYARQYEQQQQHRGYGY